MQRSKPFLNFLIALFLLFSCAKTSSIDPQPVTVEPDVKSAAKEITTFAFTDSLGNAIPNESLSISLTGDTFYIVFPHSTKITSLIPTIVITGVSIEPASGVKQNFGVPVEYTVTAENGTTRKYTIVAAVKKFSAVYFGNYNGHLYALDSDNGSILWKYKHTGGNFAYSDPMIAGGVIYAGSTDGYMYAWNAFTGEVKWKFYTGGGGIESPPAVNDGMLYFGSSNDKFYALDTANGELKWEYQTGFNVSTKGVFYDANVIFGSDDGNVYALDAQSGTLQWHYLMGGMCNQSSPVLHNGVVFIGSRNQMLHAINASDGSLKWTFSDGKCSMEMSTPFVYDSKVYMGSWYDFNDASIPGSLYALNEQTGELIWESLHELGIGASPVVGEGILFISADDNHFYALDPSTGSTKWRKNILPNGSTAAVREGTVYVGGTGTHYFYAFDAKTGVTKWRFPLPEAGKVSAPVFLSALK